MQWPISLDAPPTILQIGIGRHGAEPVERSRLDGLWCIHLYHYEAEVRLNGTAHAVAPGHVGVTPPGVEQEYRFRGAAVHAYAHFSLPELEPPGAGIAAIQSVGAGFENLNREFEEAIGWFPAQPRRAEARLWDILWQLALLAPPAAPTLRPHPAVRRAVARIEMRLAEPISVAALAGEVGLSHNHLTRLFHSHTGQTVAGYIAQRRLLRPRHLLLHSTLPVKVIAAQVGMADLYLFNKTVRRALGASPRRLRECGQDPRTQESDGMAPNKTSKEYYF